MLATSHIYTLSQAPWQMLRFVSGFPALPHFANDSVIFTSRRGCSDTFRRPGSIRRGIKAGHCQRAVEAEISGSLSPAAAFLGSSISARAARRVPERCQPCLIELFFIRTVQAEKQALPLADTIAQLARGRGRSLSSMFGIAARCRLASLHLFFFLPSPFQPQQDYAIS